MKNYRESYKQTVAPTLYPVTLDEAKAHCSLDGIDDHDTYLWSLIESATATVEARLARQVMAATWTLTLDRFPREILVKKAPVTSVTSVKYRDESGTQQTLAATEYQVDLHASDGPARIKPAYEKYWPTVQVGTYDAVVVTFGVGAASASTVPKTIKHAILFLVAHWFRNREPASEVALADIPSGLDMLLSLSDWGCY